MATATPVKKPASAAPSKKNIKAAVPAPTPVKASPVKALPAKPVRAKSVLAKPAPTKTDKKKDKPEKVKVVRDSFTIPKTEYVQIATLKKRAMDLGLEVKKSELIRAGLLLLTAASDTALRKAVGNVPTLKTGRPGKA